MARRWKTETLEASEGKPLMATEVRDFLLSVGDDGRLPDDATFRSFGERGEAWKLHVSYGKEQLE